MADGDLIFTRDEDGVTFGPPAPPPAPEAVPHSANLATMIQQTSLDAIAETLTETVAFDQDGLSPWEEIATDVMDHLGVGPDAEPDDGSDETSDTSSHTLMLTALLRFQAKALSVMLPSDDMAIRTKPAFDLTQIEDEAQRDEMTEKISAAERRVQQFYTDYLFHKLPSYEEDTDQILHDMGLMGVGLRKIVVDRSRTATPVMPEYVALGDLIVSYSSRNFRMGRYAHKMDMPTGDLIRRIQTGVYRPIKLVDQDTPDSTALSDARDKVYGLVPANLMNSETHRIYEVYTHLYLAADQHPLLLPRPYIVTIHSASREILAIQRNWDAADPDETPLEHFVGYIYHPGKNAVTGLGLGQILLQTTKALRKAQRRTLEAGYLQNHPSGFKLSNLSIRNGDTKVRPGEFVDVDSPTGDIRAALMMHPFQGPSQGLMALAQTLEANGRELGGIASIDFASLMKAGVAAGPAMAAFEESTEFQTSVHRRLYKAHRKELEIIHDRMRLVVGNKPVLFGTDQTLQPGDLTAVDILPYMQPGQASRQKVIMEAQAIWDLAKDNPDLLNKRRAAENFIRALGSPDADRLVIPDPEEEEVLPADPITEYTMILGGRPVKAGPMQNHQAHIDAHGAQMRMVQTSSLPVEQGEAVMASLAAHIAEHMGLQLMVEAAGMIGISLDKIGPDMAPEIEAQLAPMLAQAVMQIEAARRPPDPEEARIETARVVGQSRIEATRVAAEGRLALADMQARHQQELEDLKAKHAKDLQDIKDSAALDREIEDNTTALTIAKLKGSGKTAEAPAGAGAGAGARAKSGANA
jgi:hypothetical protein